MYKQKNLLIKIVFSLIIICSASDLFSQDITITGKVTDSSNNTGVSNASVNVKGNYKKGTITDANGNFKITVPRGSVLTISSVNYASRELQTGNEPYVTVSLTPKSAELNEVVVIGYGTRKKKDLTGAVSTVSSEDIEKSTSMTPELALQGRAPGVFVESGGGDPQSRPVIRIRGVNTFGYSEPLYVVDGVPMYEGGAGVTTGGIGDIRSPINIFSLINPDDIESISVLKDASAAAIYGVRASNGVILITTKKGKVGRPKIDATLSYGVQNIPKLLPVLNTPQYFSLVTEAYNNNPDMDNGTIIPIGSKFGGLYSADSSQYAGNDPTYDWQDELLNKNAPIQNYNVRVSGGTEGLNYYFSGGYAKTESPLKANSLERYSIATNIDSRISKIFSAGITVRLVQENSYENTQADLPTMASSIPFEPFYDPNDPTGFNAVAAGSFVPNPAYDPSLLNPGAPYNFAPDDPRLLWGPQSRFNVFAFQALNNNSYNLYNVLGNAYVQVEPIQGLKIKASYGGSYYENLRKSWNAFDSWRFSQTPGNPYAGQDGNSKGSYGERQGRTININKELTVNYTHAFGEHHVDVILGVSDQFARWNVNDLSGQVNYADPQYRSITNQPPYTQGFAGILQEDQLIGYLSRISYNYSEKYYLDATLRYDGSSRLAPGHKWDYFPSFAGAWRISAEKFFPRTTFINDLKIRGGWGKLGNYQSAGYYEFLSGISTTSDYPLGSGGGDPYGTQYQGATLPSFANTTLGWEKVKTTSIGFDAILFNNHVNFTAEYYNKLTYGIIQSVSLPPNTGIQNPADINIGEVKNSGVEFNMGYNAKIGPVNFNVAANLTTVTNKVQKLYGGTPLGDEFGRIEEGYSMFYLWGYKTGGVFQSQQDIDAWRQSHADVNIGQDLNDPSVGYQYKPGDMYFQDVYGNPEPGSKERYSKTPDSLINSNDRTYLGKTIPGYYYGLNIGANWRGLDISIFFQGVGDVQKYNSLQAGLQGMSGLANASTKALDRWTNDNHSTSVPRAVYGDPAQANRISDRFVEDAGYFRLKNLQVGYSLPSSLMNKLGFIKNFRIYFTAVNLFTITNYTGYDPENDLVPPTRQFLAGLNLNF